MPGAQAVWISAQVNFVMIRLTATKYVEAYFRQVIKAQNTARALHRIALKSFLIAG